MLAVRPTRSTINISFLLLVFLIAGRIASAQTWTADNGNGTFSNPLFYDEFSDPDMIRVDSDFYLTGTTMHSMPGVPILHSRDLVNWEFEAYALDHLDLGPEYRLEDGKNIYGQGIWAPCFRYHNGNFYIFSNVNGRTTQLFHSTNPRGPWTQTAMKKSFHDLSVLFDDDGKVYIVWGYRDIRIAQLNSDLTDVVDGTERILIHKEEGMGEGLHLYKIKGKYFITSAWYMDLMRMPVARADRLDGPWEVNQNISRGEQFGQVLGYRLDQFRPPLHKAPYTELPPDPHSIGRMAIHQGGLIDTHTGEWWGFSMGEANAIGRVTTLSPITWKDGWPYFGLPGNLGRSPRTWVKPHTGTTAPAHAPYLRNDDFSKPVLQAIWQWNHVPVDSKWSLAERPGFLRLHALPAKDLWDARNTLTQRAIGPKSTPTVLLDAAGLKPGDIAGLALFNQPEAWIGIQKEANGFSIVQFDGQTQKEQHVPVAVAKIWLRADCDFSSQIARFSYSTDGVDFHGIGDPFVMVGIGFTFQGVRYSLFNFNRNGTEAGFADFDQIQITEPNPHGLTRPIPYGKQIALSTHGQASSFSLIDNHGTLQTADHSSTSWTVVDRGLGRVALSSNGRFISVTKDGAVSLAQGSAGNSETFQWSETFTGELTLLSLQTNRYLCIDNTNHSIMANNPGPEPIEDKEQVRFDWSLVK